MWSRSVFLRTLRGYRTAVVAWGASMAVTVLYTMAAANQLIGTASGRASLTSIADSFSWNAAPVAVDTTAGYATFKIGTFMLCVAIWPLLAGSRTLRGEEERGVLDVLLAVPHSRARIAIEKLAALWTALLGMGVLMGLIIFAGSRHLSPNFGLGDAILFGLDVALVSAVFGGLALLISQFTLERREAAGWTAALLAAAVVLDMVHRVVSGTDWISRLSPVYYYNLSKPLVASYGTSAGGMLVLVALAVILGLAAIPLFARRDIGGTTPLPGWLRLPARAHRRPAPLPVGEWSLRSVYTRSLGAIAAPTLWWTLGIAGFAAWIVVGTEQIQGRLSSLYSSSSFLRSLVEKVGGGAVAQNETLLSTIFVILPVLLMVFVVTQVNRWAADEEQGRLELLLSTPQSRVRVMLGRFAAVATASVVIGVVTLAASAITSATSGLRLDGGHLAEAALGMIPLGLLVAALGYLASGWLRTAADTGLLGVLLAAWFFISFVGPELPLPGAVLRLSALYYYGTPLLHGLRLVNVAGVLAVAALALAAGSWRFARKDLAG